MGKKQKHVNKKNATATKVTTIKSYVGSHENDYSIDEHKVIPQINFQRYNTAICPLSDAGANSG